MLSKINHLKPNIRKLVTFAKLFPFLMVTHKCSESSRLLGDFIKFVAILLTPLAVMFLCIRIRSGIMKSYAKKHDGWNYRLCVNEGDNLLKTAY